MTLEIPAPWKHQAEARERAKDLPFFGLFFEPGTGKSKTAIDMLRDKFNQHKRFLRTFVFAPPVTLKNWRNEFLMHSKIDPKKIYVLQGAGKKRFTDFCKLAWDNAEVRDGKLVRGAAKEGIFITNYESLLMEDLYDAFFKWRADCFVFDESHYLKSPKAGRSEKAQRLANPLDAETKSIRAPIFRSILTGTPILNSAMDLFQQFYVLDGGRTFTGNFYRFRGLYFANRNANIPKRAGVFIPEKWELKTKEQDGFDAANEFNRLLYRHAMHAAKSECLDLPPLVSTYRRVAMTPDQARMYKEMKRDFVTYVQSNKLEAFEGDEPPPEAVVATMAVTKLIRLMQIASSYYKTDRGVEKTIEDTPKAKALRDLLVEISPHHKVLIWTTWRETYAQIRRVCDELGLRYVEVHGDISAVRKQENVASFEADPGLRVLIGHPGSGGIGVNLVSASYSIYYSLGHSLGHYIQSRDRNHRGGSEKHDKITHIHLVCENTVDETIREALVNKQALSDKILLEIASRIE